MRGPRPPEGGDGEVETISLVSHPVGLQIRSRSARWAPRAPRSCWRLCEWVLLSRVLFYDKAAGRGAAGLNGVVDSRPLPQAVGFGPFCAEPLRSYAPRISSAGQRPNLSLFWSVQLRSVNISLRLSCRRGRLPRRRVALHPHGDWRERELLLTAIPRRIHRISSDLRS